MKALAFPLEEISIFELYSGAREATYEVPIYQRNYAWGKDDINALVQDVYDASMKNENGVYYIGTLVSFHKGDQVFEIIDGQQRLTTIYIILSAIKDLGVSISIKNRLTYKARKKSNDTIENLLNLNIDEKDMGIVHGLSYAKSAIGEIVPSNEMNKFCDYFLKQVHIIHYKVPKDIDLNHYFEIMNSRGEQLEKHEIIKARLLSIINEGETETEKEKSRQDRFKFNYIWENCSDMSVYVQQKSKETSIFGDSLCDFVAESFDDIKIFSDESNKAISIEMLIEGDSGRIVSEKNKSKEKPDSFQAIIDFPNFLLIVLKLTRIMQEGSFDPATFNLDDKELITEFDKKDLKKDSEWVKKFGYNLLKARFFLDNYIVHHSNEEDSVESNPWMLQKWHKDDKKGYLKNLADGKDGTQTKLVQLLSMFEVSFTARQRKNYLFYCLLYLFKSESLDVNEYCVFVENLAEKCFRDVYLAKDNLNSINTPSPGSFDSVILKQGALVVTSQNRANLFNDVYGDGNAASPGIPLFVFNYLDYKLWLRYAKEIRGEKLKEGADARKVFFDALGCNDFGLDDFKSFYFSRTRRSLEHYFPQAKAGKEGDLLDNNQINCFGNYAMIGSEMNSSGSNWDPSVKLTHYMDSGKVKKISVASLKFRIMMQMCEDNVNEKKRDTGKEWIFEDIQRHHQKMVAILMN